MAFATALAAASCPRRAAAALLVAAMLSSSAAVSAAEQVYIWRDQNGAVRFSPVQDVERISSGTPESAACEIDAQPTVLISQANDRGSH